LSREFCNMKIYRTKLPISIKSYTAVMGNRYLCLRIILIFLFFIFVYMLDEGDTVDSNLWYKGDRPANFRNNRVYRTVQKKLGRRT
jgi:hypothetical protein